MNSNAFKQKREIVRLVSDRLFSVRIHMELTHFIPFTGKALRGGYLAWEINRTSHDIGRKAGFRAVIVCTLDDDTAFPQFPKHIFTYSVHKWFFTLIVDPKACDLFKDISLMPSPFNIECPMRHKRRSCVIGCRGRCTEALYNKAEWKEAKYYQDNGRIMYHNSEEIIWKS